MEKKDINLWRVTIMIANPVTQQGRRGMTYTAAAVEVVTWAR